MPVSQLIIGLVVAGAVLWAINALIPMSPAIKKLINIVVVILAAVFVLQFFGVLRGGPRLWVIG